MYVSNRFAALGTAVFAGAMAATALVGTANATTAYDTSLVTPGVYYGSGNTGTNYGLTVNTASGVELALGTILRFVGPALPSPTNGNVYYVPTGTSGGLALWDIVFSVNLQAGSGNGGLVLSGINPLLTVTDLTTPGSFSFNPLGIPDNAGWNGSKNTAILNLTTDYGFQNAENPSFAVGFNPYANDTYVVTLSAGTAAGDTTSLGSVSEQINATPLPAALPLFAGGLGLMGLLARRRKRKAAALAVA